VNFNLDCILVFDSKNLKNIKTLIVLGLISRTNQQTCARPSHVNHQCRSDQIRIYSLVNLSKHRLRPLQIYINSSREEQRFAPLCMDKALKIERSEPATQSLDGCLDGLLNTLSWASYTLPARNWTRMTQISLR
jgi:hypothetical protein